MGDPNRLLKLMIMEDVHEVSKVLVEIKLAENNLNFFNKNGKKSFIDDRGRYQSLWSIEHALNYWRDKFEIVNTRIARVEKTLEKKN
jgi:hypothetical protein